MSSGHPCPHCGSDMDPIRTPVESSWGGEVHHICFNDDCSYFTRAGKPWRARGLRKRTIVAEWTLAAAADRLRSGPRTR